MTTRPRARLMLALGAAAAAFAAVLAVWLLRPDTRPAGGDDPGAAAAGDAPFAQDEGAPLRYDVEYPSIAYSTAAPTDRVAALAERLAAGDDALGRRRDRGYLDDLLDALDIDPASQVLVFSTTSLQVGRIGPSTPRAIYFNDDVYVAWVQGGPIEIASMDPRLGPVFYTVDETGSPAFDRHTQRCLRCHDSFSLTGGGVPRFIVGSGYIGTKGDIVAHEGWILTTQQTPIKNRWGGWYVTGRHGDQVHLGNIVVRNVADLADLERLRIGNRSTLDGLVDTSPYAAPGSDIVALLVMQHQVDVQNQIARVNYKVRSMPAGAAAGAPDVRVAEIVEPLVEAMLFVGEAPLAARIEGSSDFGARFERRGPRDDAGRSLRDLDLERRLLRHPLSWLVYSAAFDALPQAAKDQAYRRFAEVLRGEDASGKLDHLSDDDRAAILEILLDTKPDFAAAFRGPAGDAARTEAAAGGGAGAR